jgi:formaldehyde-activating enzyme involved in methanogenesis
MENYGEDAFREETLEGWVINKCDDWRNNFETNYESLFDEYYRLFRGQWSPEDRTRGSERSRIVSPAIQQAVESTVAEIEEATFGRGRWFDIKDDIGDPTPQDIVLLRERLYEDFTKTKVRKAIAECVLNSAIFGTGIAEITLSDEKEMAPATQPVMGGDLQAVGVNIRERTVCKLRSIMPQNFLIDPLATSVDDALGVAIEEFVPKHSIEILQEQGIYKNTPLETTYYDSDIEPDDLTNVYDDNKTRKTTYYGLVPRYLLKKAQQEGLLSEDDEEIVETLVDDEEEGTESYYVEAIVCIANKGVLLKAEENPYMMQDRPIIAFPFDVVPSRFWGRGVCEKGYNSQKALDAELRARIDALALTIHPMLAMDASRMPRGSKPEVRAGKVILTNGNPSETLQPFNFGQVNQITFAQAEALQKMVQTATGAVDPSGTTAGSDTRSAAGFSMGLGTIIKRHKRTLINFQESFLLPFVTKVAHRYMQFEPELYPVGDYKFIASSSLGVVAREYEIAQLTQLLQTMGDDNPVKLQLLSAIIDNMSLSNREELLAVFNQAAQPNPQQAQIAQLTAQAQLEFQQSQTNALNGQAQEASARAAKLAVETQTIPQELEIDRIKAITTNLKAGTQDDKEFERRIKISEQLLKERDIASKEQQQANAKQQEMPLEQPQQPTVTPIRPQAAGVS